LFTPEFLQATALKGGRNKRKEKRKKTRQRGGELPEIWGMMQAPSTAIIYQKIVNQTNLRQKTEAFLTK
jgi:hypothetical protein